MHAEDYVMSRESAARLNRAREEGRRIIAIGTTALRVLEDQAQRGNQAEAGRYTTRLFLRPGVPIQWVSGLITNFHLPRSSLLTLVAAVAGYQEIMAAYREAIAMNYRFYSFGDASLIWRTGVGS